MAKLLKLRRGTTTQHSSFTGAEGECTVDTTKDTLVVHDGSQAGGRPMLREDLNNLAAGAVTHAMLAGDAVDGDNIGDDVVNSEHIAAGAIDLEHMSSQSVDEDNLHISNAPTNGYVLTARSGNAGGMTWESASQDAGYTQFIGFKRESDGNLRCDYSVTSDSVTYTASDYNQWVFVDDNYLHTSASLTRLGSYTRPDGSTPAIGQPKYHINSAGNLILTV